MEPPVTSANSGAACPASTTSTDPRWGCQYRAVQTDIVGVDQVKGLKPAEVRQALCDAGLSPVGDKNELLKVRRCRKLTVIIIFPC